MGGSNLQRADVDWRKVLEENDLQYHSYSKVQGDGTQSFVSIWTAPLFSEINGISQCLGEKIASKHGVELGRHDPGGSAESSNPSFVFTVTVSREDEVASAIHRIKAAKEEYRTRLSKLADIALKD